MDVISLTLATYILVMAITPGPNNMLLAVSGVNYGLRRTLPMMLGIALGGGFHCFVSMLMFGHLLELVSIIRLPIAVVGCLYLLWLAWQIFRAEAPENGEQGRPLTFMQMVLFQWVNPKAWVMMLNMAALFMPEQGPLWSSAMLIGMTDAVVSLPCVLLWAWLGDRLRLVLQSPRHLLLFNGLMAVCLALTAAWLLLDEIRLLLV